LYNIEYYVTQTEEMTGEAKRLGLEPLVEEAAYSIFRLPDTAAVDVAGFVPMVYEGEEEFLEVALDWYDDLNVLDHWIVTDGPEEWLRFDEIGDEYDLGDRLDTEDAVVSNIVIEDHRISFRTNAVGVPHLVKTSYFPNWEATGADGPYRAAPSLMIVVPTQEEVSLEFARTWTENLGMVFTILALVFVGWWAYRSRARRRGLAQPARSD
jgi:cbb3-type cytochrome oxidase subunit 3